MTPNILDPVAKKSETIKDENAENIVRSRKIGDSEEKFREDNCNNSNHSELSHSIENNKTNGESHNSHEPQPFKPQIRWPDLMAQVFIHVGSLYGLFYLIALKAKLYTYVWCKHAI